MRRLFGVLLLSAAALLSCQVILGLEEPVGTQPPAEASDGGAVDLCAHRNVPGKPATADGVDRVPEGQWFVTQRYDIPYQDDAGLGPGLDLDQSCTCNPDPAKRDALDGGPSCKPLIGLNADSCDKGGGVDDSFGSSVASFLASVPSLDPRADGNEDIQLGLRSGMVWVGRWNGEMNDPSVSVALIGSSGLVDRHGCQEGELRVDAPDGSTVGDQVYYPPLFDGCDRWSVQPADTIRSPSTGFPTPTAVVEGYVSDGILVANLPRTPIALFGPNAYANDGHLVARIRTVPGVGYALDGFVAGRVTYENVVSAFATIPVKLGGATLPLCAQPQFLSAFVGRVCSDLDIMSVPSADNSGAACDAVSVVLGIHMVTSLVAKERQDIDAGTPLSCDGGTPRCF